MIVCIDEKFYLFALDILYGFFVKKLQTFAPTCSLVLTKNEISNNCKTALYSFGKKKNIFILLSSFYEV